MTVLVRSNIAGTTTQAESYDEAVFRSSVETRKIPSHFPASPDGGMHWAPAWQVAGLERPPVASIMSIVAPVNTNGWLIAAGYLAFFAWLTPVFGFKYGFPVGVPIMFTGPIFTFSAAREGHRRLKLNPGGFGRQRLVFAYLGGGFAFALAAVMTIVAMGKR
jgi:hypothetical protein